MFSFRELPNYSDLMVSELKLLLDEGKWISPVFRFSSFKIHYSLQQSFKRYYDFRVLNRVSKLTERCIVNHSGSLAF
jgi:hypothetical protein